MAIKIQETPTRILLSGPPAELAEIAKSYEYRPDNYWMADSYQIFRQWRGQIKKAIKDGNESLAQALEDQPRGWDGWTRLMKIKQLGEVGHSELQRGHLADVLDHLEALEIEVDASKLLKNPFDGITIEDIPDDLLAVDLDPQQWEIQKRCVLAWLSHGMGRNKVTVSGGKTAMFCAAAAMVKLKFPAARFLYFTPTERLRAQVYTEAKKFLPDWDITKFGGGKDSSPDGKDMVVATAAIMNKRFLELHKSGWFKTFMGLLLDENQFACSPSLEKCIRASSAYFRFSASDTTKEDNIAAHLALTGACGPIYERVEAAELFALDRIAVPTIEVIHVPRWAGKFNDIGHTPEEYTPAWILADGEWLKGTYMGPVYELDNNGDYKLNRRKEPIKMPGLWTIEIDGKQHQVESRWCLLQRKYDQAIIRFGERNDIIAKKAVEYASRGWPTLIVATRTLHVMILQAVVSKYWDEDSVRVLYSAHTPAERDEAFSWFKSTPGSILISPLVKIGVSINQIRGGVIADFVSDHSYFNQLVGRFMRRKPDGTPNEAELTMFADNQHHSYATTSANLIDKMKQIEGYKWKETTL